jgi:HSP20 family protein
MVEKSELGPSVPDWWSQYLNPVRHFGERVAEFFSPNSEASATEAAYEIAVELPGVADADISVEVEDGRLTVTGEKQAEKTDSGKSYYFSERSYGKFRRSFRLPEDADVDHITATHTDGVLMVAVPKKAPTAAKPKSIKVKKG